MTDTKHTPGPWFAASTEGEEGGIAYLVNGEENTVSVADVWDVDGCEANAALIAAAPDMYEALQRIIPRYAQYRDEDGFPGSTDAALDAARAALAKAEGR